MPQAFEIYNVDVRPRSSARTEEAYRLLHPEDGRVDGVLALLRDPIVLFASPHLVRFGDWEEQDDCLYGLRYHGEELYSTQRLDSDAVIRKGTHVRIKTVDVLEVRLARDEPCTDCPLQPRCLANSPTASVGARNLYLCEHLVGGKATPSTFQPW